MVELTLTPYQLEAMLDTNYIAGFEPPKVTKETSDYVTLEFHCNGLADMICEVRHSIFTEFINNSKYTRLLEINWETGEPISSCYIVRKDTIKNVGENLVYQSYDDSVKIF
jgi:hypothetical protein